MKHGLKQRKLNRTSSHRLALLKNLSISLIKHETITTTTEKAKELRPFIEKLVTKAKKDSLSNRKYILSKLLIIKKLAKNFFLIFQTNKKIEMAAILELLKRVTVLVILLIQA
jgi:large subunit ribosomal protein L17